MGGPNATVFGPSGEPPGPFAICRRCEGGGSNDFSVRCSRGYCGASLQNLTEAGIFGYRGVDSSGDAGSNSDWHDAAGALSVAAGVHLGTQHNSMGGVWRAAPCHACPKDAMPIYRTVDSGISVAAGKHEYSYHKCGCRTGFLRSDV